jgi:hypothetical protein
MFALTLDELTGSFIRGRFARGCLMKLLYILRAYAELNIEKGIQRCLIWE